MNTKHLKNCAVLAVAAVLLISSMVTAQTKGTFTDPRDKKSYRTVKIGKFTWMAENLNYQTKDSWCYDNDNSNCAKYGRLYTWNAAKSACPAGWRLPSDAEWNDLTAAVGGTFVTFIDDDDNEQSHWKNAGTKLKSKSDWLHYDDGTDDFGFSALPGGFRWSDGNFHNGGSYGHWWSATEAGVVSAARSWSMYNLFDHVSEGEFDKAAAASVRCLRN